MTDERNLELEDSLFRDLDDANTWMVYGDWLTSIGDPRGELISLARTPTPSAFSRIAAILRENRDTWLEGIDRDQCEFTWRYGFIDGIKWRPGAGDAEMQDRVLELPAARFLRTLRIAPYGEANFDECLSALARRTRPIRFLECESRVHVLGSLHESLEQLPHLRRLRVLARDMSLSITHSSLRELDVVLRGPELATKDNELRLPDLRTYTCRAAGVDPTSVFALQNLEHITVDGPSSIWVRALMKSPVLQQLREVKFVAVSPDCAEVLIANAEHLHVSQLELSVTAPNVDRGVYDRMVKAGLHVSNFREPEVYDAGYE